MQTIFKLLIPSIHLCLLLIMESFIQHSLRQSIAELYGSNNITIIILKIFSGIIIRQSISRYTTCLTEKFPRLFYLWGCVIKKYVGRYYFSALKMFYFILLKMRKMLQHRPGRREHCLWIPLESTTSFVIDSKLLKNIHEFYLRKISTTARIADSPILLERASCYLNL